MDHNSSESTPLLTGVRRRLSSLFPSSNAHPSRRTQSMIQHMQTDENARPELNAVLQEMRDADETSAKTFALSILAIIVHILVGTLFLYFVEGLALYDSLYFCIVTMTTVGYGDITPQSTLSKLFVIVYVIISILVLSTIVANMVGSLIDEQEELIVSAMVSRNQPRGGNSSEARSSHDSATSRIMDATTSLSSSDYYALGVSTVYLAIVLVIGVIVFMVFEKFSFIDAVYTTVISATTVGFGDFEPTETFTKLIMTVWLVLSTVLLVKVVADYADARLKAKQRAVSRRMLTARFDSKSWREMDKDRDGTVDKTEFLSELLVRSGKVEQEEIDGILARFEQLDHDESGHVDVHEISEEA